MNFTEALELWRREGGVIQVVGPEYRTFVVRYPEDGEDWRRTCRFALQHADWTEEQIAEELS